MHHIYYSHYLHNISKQILLVLAKWHLIIMVEPLFYVRLITSIALKISKLLAGVYDADVYFLTLKVEGMLCTLFEALHTQS